MKSNLFIEKLKHIESLPTTYYSVAGGDWARWNGSSWNFDCVILIKAILWGWNGNKIHSHGGALYGSNGVYDDTADGLINRCKEVSSDFTKIAPGEVVWLDGHVGVYIGNGEVIECTGAWERKVLRSKIGSKGERTRNGKQVYAWKKHGKLPYIEYVVETKTETKTETNLKYKVGDVVEITGVYTSSVSKRKLKPKITKGTITKVLPGTNNPYLLNNGNIGWVNENCIVSCENVSKETIYVVKKGDTLSKIASKYNINVQKLYDDNRVTIGDNPNLIHPGQKLVIK